MSVITYEDLLASFKKGLRNGNWRKQKSLDKALFRASLWYAKHRGSIVNTSLVEKLSALIEKLKETKGMRIFKRGFKKAVEMLDKYGENDVFIWGISVKTLAERPRLHLMARDRDDAMKLDGEEGRR
jgi:hypothetical protein